MKLVSWNVAGLRSCNEKSKTLFASFNLNILIIREVDF